MAETFYAVMNGNTIANIIVNKDAALAAANGWIGPIVPSATIAIGSTTSDGGHTWVAPPPFVVPIGVQNAATIRQNLTNQLATIETWITANPTGAVLNAAQTLVVAKMLAGLTRDALALNQTVGGSS